MAHPFCTIGHSTRPVTEFVDLLKGAQVEVVLDVRSIPRSRTNPQYDWDSLPETLARFAIGYEHIAALGGLRKEQQVAPNPFRCGLARLRALGHERRSAIMCAEAVWWRCHRRIIADYLLAAGETVFHLLGTDRIEQARMTEAAQRREDGSLIYGAQGQA